MFLEEAADSDLVEPASGAAFAGLDTEFDLDLIIWLQVAGGDFVLAEHPAGHVGGLRLVGVPVVSQYELLTHPRIAGGFARAGHRLENLVNKSFNFHID